MHIYFEVGVGGWVGTCTPEVCACVLLWGLRVIVG